MGNLNTVYAISLFILSVVIILILTMVFITELDERIIKSIINKFNKMKDFIIKNIKNRGIDQYDIDNIKKNIDEKNKMYDNTLNDAIKDNTHVEVSIDNIDLSSYNVQHTELTFQKIMTDLENMIQAVLVSELFSIEVNGGLKVSNDKKLKEIISTLTKKTLISMQPNFRLQIYFFINEDLLTSIVYSLMARKILEIANK